MVDMSSKTDAWDVRQSEASGNWYVNTGREIWKCFDEDRARLIASAPELRAENEQLRRERNMLVLDRDAFEKDVERLRAAATAVLKAHAEWERACELDSDHADDAWYGLHDAIEHDLKPLL